MFVTRCIQSEIIYDCSKRFTLYSIAVGRPLCSQTNSTSFTLQLPCKYYFVIYIHHCR